MTFCRVQINSKCQRYWHLKYKHIGLTNAFLLPIIFSIRLIKESTTNRQRVAERVPFLKLLAHFHYLSSGVVSHFVNVMYSFEESGTLHFRCYFSVTRLQRRIICTWLISEFLPLSTSTSDISRNSYTYPGRHSTLVPVFKKRFFKRAGSVVAYWPSTKTTRVQSWWGF